MNQNDWVNSPWTQCGVYCLFAMHCLACCLRYCFISLLVPKEGLTPIQKWDNVPVLSFVVLSESRWWNEFVPDTVGTLLPLHNGRCSSIYLNNQVSFKEDLEFWSTLPHWAQNQFAVLHITPSFALLLSYILLVWLLLVIFLNLNFDLYI